MTVTGRWFALCVGLVMALAGCSGSPGSRQAPSSPAGARLPPATLAELAPIFDPQVGPLGLRVTRASLVTADARRPSADGTHLALYVEPVSQWSASRHVEAIVPLARTLAPSVFARWPGVESFDVCQEPSPGVDDRPEPMPVSTLDLSREASEAIDWETIDLVSLAVASVRRPDVSLSASPAIVEEPALRAAFEEAETTVGTGG